MQILMPQLGETVTEGTVSIWHRREGETVDVDDLLFEIETDKVATEVTAPATGVLSRILVTEGQTVPVGTLIAEISVAGNADEDSASVAPSMATYGVTAAAPGQGSTRNSRLPRRDQQGRPLSPAVRRLVHEHGVDLDRLAGSGRNGRVRRQDVIQHLEEQRGSNASTNGTMRRSAAVAMQVTAPARAGNGSRLVPFNRLRKRAAEHMVLSKATSPHVLQAVEVDFRNVASVRSSMKDVWRQRQGYALTYLPFVAYAVCRTLADFPLVNASVEGESLRVHEDVNLAIAIDLNFDGLVAPVIRGAQALSIAELAHAIDDITRRARTNKLVADELKLGTYTISNSGSFGTLITAPIINQPQVAILSMDGIRKRPWIVEGVDGDSIAIRPVGVLAQSFDHRAIDGAYSAAFLRALKQRIESGDWDVLIRS